MSQDPYARFRNLDFDGFRKLAGQELDPIEKVGFPVAYRAGREHLIVDDIARKLANLGTPRQIVVDIGPGCSGVALRMIELCRTRGHMLVLIDSAEMLSQLPDAPFIRKVPGRYPDECPDLLVEYAGRVNALVTYSVLQYVLAEADPFAFLDASLGLLAEGGELLIGDLPNESKRRRFLASAEGVRFRDGGGGVAAADQPRGEQGAETLDDRFVLGVVAHCRERGFDAYVLPQSPDLPMANRREDILIVRP
jgi:hypothetical protein